MGGRSEGEVKERKERKEEEQEGGERGREGRMDSVMVGKKEHRLSVPDFVLQLWRKSEG